MSLKRIVIPAHHGWIHTDEHNNTYPIIAWTIYVESDARQTTMPEAWAVDIYGEEIEPSNRTIHYDPQRLIDHWNTDTHRR